MTITTVGYGDLTAGTSTGRVLVTFEALIGQIFLVTLVARLVSMYGTRQRPAGDGPADSGVEPSQASRSQVEQELGQLHRVERGALAQVVAGDPEVEGVLLRRVFAEPTRPAPGRCPRPRAASASRRRRRPAAPRARRRAARPRRHATTARRTARWPPWRGRRTPARARRWRWRGAPGACRILRLSCTSFHSSLV